MSQISVIANLPPTIHKINPKDYGNILDVGEKLKDDNWAKWRELFMLNETRQALSPRELNAHSRVMCTVGARVE